LPKEDLKSIIAISQSPDSNEYKYKSYEELSKECQQAVARAFELIPQMYNRLTLVDGLPHKDAFAKILNDHNHLSGFTERNIRRYLPANNPNIPRRVRTSRPKNSPTETSVETSFSDTKHNDEKNIKHKIETQNVSNHVLDDISSDRTNNLSTVDTIPLAPNEPNKANLKTNVLNQEIALPCRESLRYISSQLNKGKNEFCISIKVNLDTGKIISVKIGRNSERDTNSFRNIY